MKRLACLLFAVTLIAQTPAPKRERYDPENLPANEIACGHDKEQRSEHPCQCMKKRLAIQEEMTLACYQKASELERNECLFRVPSCPVVPDAETYRFDYDSGTYMPPACKRSCHKAKCKCCTS